MIDSNVQAPKHSTDCGDSTRRSAISNEGSRRPPNRLHGWERC